MAALPPGHFRLIPFVEPPVPAGSYLLTGDVSGLPGAVQSLQSRVEIEAPRYTMPPDQILSTFPPAGARGSFTSRLPQIVLRRRTLPWERSTDLDGNVATTPRPWLALVLIAEGEGQLLSDVPVANCVSDDVDLGDDADVPKGACLELPQSVVDKVFPTEEDLHLLCHVREVDLTDTELALGDDDGYLAVVMGNRLPQPGVKYLACLINLEEQFDKLPVIPEPSLTFTYTPVAAVADFRVSYSAAGSGGSGTAGTGLDSALMNLPLAGGSAAFGGGHLAAPESAASPDRAAPAAAPAIGAEHASGFVSAAHGAAAHVGATWAPAGATSFVSAEQDFGLKGKLALADGFSIGHFLIPTRRFPVLAYWSFTCEERGDFQYLATNVHGRMLGHVIQGAETPDGDPIGPEHPVTPGNAAQPGVTRELPLVAETGHVLLDHVSRRGEAAPAWFRGPLTAAAVPRSEAPEPGAPPPLAHHADQLRRVVPDGQEDLGYSAAFEIGRLLALSQPGVVAALSRWRAEAFGAARVTSTTATAIAALPSAVLDAFAIPDPLAKDAETGLRAPSVGARAARALVGALGEDPSGLLGPARPVADPGVAAGHLRGVFRGGEAALLNGFGLTADSDDPDEVLNVVAAAPVRVLAQGNQAIDSAILRSALENAAGAVAADATTRGRPGTEPGLRAAIRNEPDALDQLIAARKAVREQGDEP